MHFFTDLILYTESRSWSTAYHYGVPVNHSLYCRLCGQSNVEKDLYVARPAVNDRPKAVVSVLCLVRTVHFSEIEAVHRCMCSVGDRSDRSGLAAPRPVELHVHCSCKRTATIKVCDW